jgi:UDP-N-acetylglucosamine 2-epimerase
VRVVTVVGARPQFVKAAPVSRVLRERHTEVLVHTGQHYDDAMSAAFFRDLEMPEPAVNLGVGSGSHAVQTAEMLRRLEPVMAEQVPDGVLVYGDTNSTLAAAIVAAKLTVADGRRPWLAHVEAGLRSFNRTMPEERNRVVADHLADLLLAPTPLAMENLHHEGLDHRAALVGDVMVDAHAWAAQRSEDHLPHIAEAHPGYVLLTLHRAENVDDPDLLAARLAAMELDHPVIFPAHPRTRQVMEKAGIRPPANVSVVHPVGYLEMVALETHALAIATDSGGVQKEAYLSAVPCITLRTETEWVETVESGWNRLAGPEPTAVADALHDPDFMDRTRPHPSLHGDGRSATRIVAALEGLDMRWKAAPADPAERREPMEAARP